MRFVTETPIFASESFKNNKDCNSSYNAEIITCKSSHFNTYYLNKKKIRCPMGSRMKNPITIRPIEISGINQFELKLSRVL